MGTIIVQKYGGTSVATVEKIQGVARKAIEAKQDGFDVVVVVSAMGHSTDELTDTVCEIDPDPDRREYDRVLATGEVVSSSLLAMAIQKEGVDAIALTGGQCGIRTNDAHGNARIVEIRPQRVLDELATGRIVVAAGFQGDTAMGEVTTIGRGGSDTTAVALAAALDAEYCDIYTDVSGVYSTDPRVVESALPLERVHYQDVEAMGWHGMRVLKAECVELARDTGIALRVLSTFGDGRATQVDGTNESLCWRPGRSPVAGVVQRRDLVGVQVVLEGDPRELDLFDAIAVYDLGLGRIEAPTRASTLYLSTEEIPDVPAFCAALDRRFGDRVDTTPDLGSVALVGFGLGSRPRALFEALRLLRGHGIDVVDTFTSREALIFVLPVERVDEGTRVLHEGFVAGGLGRMPGATEASGGFTHLTSLSESDDTGA
ncbi:MAG: aspartate kinase [Acidobacteriota bacterium]